MSSNRSAKGFLYLSRSELFSFLFSWLFMSWFSVCSGIWATWTLWDRKMNARHWDTWQVAFEWKRIEHFLFLFLFSSPKCPNCLRCESVMNRFKVKWLCVVPPGVTSWLCAAKQGRSCWSGFSSSHATGSTSPAVSNSSASPYRLERERVFCGLSVSVCLRWKKNYKKIIFSVLLCAHILQSCAMEPT